MKIEIEYEPSYPGPAGLPLIILDLCQTALFAQLNHTLQLVPSPTGNADMYIGSVDPALSELKRLNPKFKLLPTYASNNIHLYNRGISQTTLGQITESSRLFVKPVDTKVFPGVAIRSYASYMRLICVLKPMLTVYTLVQKCIPRI